MQVTTVGLDLAKNIFQVHGVTENGEVAFNQALRRAQLLAFFEKLPPCLVLSRFSSGLFRAMFAMKEIENGKEIHRRVSA